MDTISQLILGIWGATLSTSLALIKIWEVWQLRLRLSTSYEWSSSDQDANQVIIENPTSTPVMISYWELLWRKRRGLRLNTTCGRYPNEGYCNIVIPAHGRHVLRFEGLDWFEWGVKAVPLGKLYLKLHVVGRRRPLTLFVYDPMR